MAATTARRAPDSGQGGSGAGEGLGAGEAVGQPAGEVCKMASKFGRSVGLRRGNDRKRADGGRSTEVCCACAWGCPGEKRSGLRSSDAAVRGTLFCDAMLP